MSARYLCYFLILVNPLAAQDYPRQNIDLQKVIEDIYGNQEDDLDYEALYENLVQSRSHPKNLNHMDEESLRDLQLLTPVQIQQLLNYRKNSGDFISIYELQSIPEFDLSIIYALAPFVYVPEPSSLITSSLWKRMNTEGDHYILIRYGQALQKKAGFDDATDTSNRFIGSPGKMCVRFRSSRPGDFSTGITFEKDEGERIQWAPRNKQYGFDYGSFHLQLVDKGKLKNIVIGDFQAQFGQGLIFGGGFGMGKGSETITTIRRSNIGLMPYTSLYEAGAFRGIGATLALTRHLSFTALASINRRDANVSEGDSVLQITSFQTTGLHRNENEILKRRKAREVNSGMMVRYQHGAWEAGVVMHRFSYDKPINRNATLYNQFAFTGKSNLNTGVFLNYSFDNFSFFSEAAKSWQGGHAIIAGLLGSLHPTFDICITARSYQRNYYAPYGNALAENTTAQNERALYWGWKYRMNRRITASGYVDVFVFPWIKFRTYRPSRGEEWLLKFDYTPTRKVRLFAQFRQEQKSRNATDDLQTYKVIATRKQNVALSSEYGIGQKLRLKTRVQWSNFKADNAFSSGIAVMQDLSFEIGKFEVSARYAQFATDDFDNRQYSYEKDVWLAYSLPAYFGTGVRQCALVEYKLNRQWTFWLRYTQTRYTDRDEIGAGVERIQGNLFNDVKFQARLKF
jgi:Helix-hairpin-helix motif